MPRSLHRFLAARVFLASLCLAACNTEDPTTAFVDNDYPAPAATTDASSSLTVYRAWWFTTYFQDPVGAGTESSEQRTVKGSETAYVLLAPGYDPTQSTPPTQFIAMRSHAPLTAGRGDALHIRVSDATFDGNCATGKALSQSDADFITQRIFPGEFDGTYDAATCTFTPAAGAGGASGASSSGAAGAGADGAAGSSAGGEAGASGTGGEGAAGAGGST